MRIPAALRHFAVRAKLLKFRSLNSAATPRYTRVIRGLTQTASVEESPLMSNARPKHLNLFQIRQPAPAIVSILHRISGALLFLFLWLFLAGLQQSLASPEAFDRLRALFDHALVKLLLLGLLWAYLHHGFAGIRHLGLDLQLGIRLPGARVSAYVVLALSFGLTAILGVVLW